MSDQTLIVCTPDVLSKAIGRIVNSPKISKSAALNILTDEVLKSKHNWGYFKSGKPLVCARGITPDQILSAMDDIQFENRPEEVRISSIEDRDGAFTLSFTQASGKGVPRVDLLMTDIEALDLLLAIDKVQDASRDVKIGSNVVRVTRVGCKVIQNGEIIVKNFSADVLRKHLEQVKDEAHTKVFDSKAGTLVHEAMISLAEGSTDIADAEDESFDLPMTVDQAIEAAVIRFLAEHDRDHAFSDQIEQRGTHWACDLVLDKGDDLLNEQLGIGDENRCVDAVRCAFRDISKTLIVKNAWVDAGSFPQGDEWNAIIDEAVKMFFQDIFESDDPLLRSVGEEVLYDQIVDRDWVILLHAARQLRASSPQ